MKRASRRDFPMDNRKPITCVRYTFDDFAIRATADGVFVDSNPQWLTRAKRDRIRLLSALARERHETLKAGKQPDSQDEPSWIDITEARRTA
jgi:hypothetical protein